MDNKEIKYASTENSYLSYEYNKTVVLLPVCGGWKNFGSRGFLRRSRLQNFVDRDSEMERVYASISESSRSANFASRVLLKNPRLPNFAARQTRVIIERVQYKVLCYWGGFVALLWSKNGGLPKCFAGLRLIKDDLESHKRRY